MATILDFPCTGTVGGRKRKTVARPAPAEVVIFPGVRYERWPDEHQVKKSELPAVGRDVLELVD